MATLYFSGGIEPNSFAPLRTLNSHTGKPLALANPNPGIESSGFRTLGSRVVEVLGI